MVKLGFASYRVRAEWENGPLHPLLRVVFGEMADYTVLRWQWMPFVTCIYRTKAEDDELEGTGVHSAWRALDVRTKDVDRDAVEDAVEHLNAEWVYDPRRLRLSVAYAKPHGSGPHLHLQVHPSTRRR